MHDYTAVLQLQADNVDALFYRGKAFLALSPGQGSSPHLDHALSDFSQVLRFIPNHAKALFQRAHCWNLKAQYDRAVGKLVRPCCLLAFRFARWLGLCVAALLELERHTCL